MPHLPDELARKLTLQEKAAIVVRRIADIIREHVSITVQNTATVGMHVFRADHHALSLRLVNFAVHHLDVYRLPRKDSDEAHQEPLDKGERFYLDFVIHRPLLRP